MKNFLIFIILIIFLIGCSNDTTEKPEPIIEQDYSACIVGEIDDINSSNQIIGQWKLTRTRVLWPEYRNRDFSNENIIYDFKPDGILVVSETEGRGAVYDTGEYTYVFEKDYLSGHPSSNEPMIWLVKIMGNKWTYKAQNNLMVIGQSYIDGTDACFERIE